MKVVLDTNVVVSAILSPHGAPARIVEAWRAEAIAVLVSEPILAEYERALGYKQVQVGHGLSLLEVAEIVDGFRRLAAVVEPGEPLAVITDDPGDNKFLECAVAGGADCIISGDRHLGALKEYEGIAVLTPTVFLAVLRQEQGGSEP